MIVRPVSYQNEQQYNVTENQIVSGVAPAGFIRFVGHAEINGQGPKGPFKLPISFPIKASSIEEAYLMFYETAQRAGHAEQKRIGDAMLRHRLTQGSGLDPSRQKSEIII